MLNPIGRAGDGLISPLLKAADDVSAISNWNSLEQALTSAGKFNGTVQLPAGPVFLKNDNYPAIRLDESRAFITIQGRGRDKTILIAGETADFAAVGVASELIGYRANGAFSTSGNEITLFDPESFPEYELGHVVYFWTRVTSPTNARSARQRTIVDLLTEPNVVRVNASIGGGYDDFKHIKGFAVSGAPSAEDTTVTLLDSALASRFSLGDDVLIGDGPGINEFYGEWVKVVHVTGGVITFEPPLRQNYENNLASIVPGWLNPLTGRRQHMSDIVIRDLSICAPKGGDFAGVFGVVRGGVRIRFENVGFIASPYAVEPEMLHELAIATCGDVTIRDGFFEGDLVLGPVQNATVDNIVANSLRVTEFSRACNILNVETRHDPGIEITGGLCSGVTLTNCVVRGDGAVALVYAEDARIENLTADQLTLANGSSGVLTTPLAPDPAGVVDGTDPGDWLEPLQRCVKDRKVRSAATGHVTVEVAGIDSQTADLQQWQDGTGDALFAIRVDGEIASANVQASAPPEYVGHRLPIYEPGGGLIGYIPIHSESL